MKKSRIAIIGLEHTHAGFMHEEFNKYVADRIEWIGCADLPASEGDVAEPAIERMKRNVWDSEDLKLYDNYKDILDQNPDLVFIGAGMKKYPDIVEETLGRGINTIIEKPMAITFEDGLRMYNAAKKSKAFFAVNWPVAWFPSFHKVKELIDAGEIGDVLRVHYRSPATLGPYDISKYSEEELSNMFWYNHNEGGGSAMDYACYGCTISTWMFGRQAESVMGIRKNFNLKFSDVEDYTAYILDFGEGAAVIEGSWSTVNNGEIPTGPVIYGTKGVIVSDRFENYVKVYKTKSRTNTEPDAVYITEPWDKITENFPKNIIDHIQYGAPLNELILPEFNIKALAALDAGIRSSYSGVAEKTEKIGDNR